MSSEQRTFQMEGPRMVQELELGTKYSRAANELREREEYMARMFGSDWWLLAPSMLSFLSTRRGVESELESISAGFIKSQLKRKRQLEPQMLEQISGFVKDRVHEVTGVGEKVDQANQILQTIENIKQGIAYKGSDPDSIEENLICRLEDLVAFIVALSNCANMASLLATLHLYIRTHYTNSVSKKLMQVVCDSFGVVADVGESLEVQSGEDEVQDAFQSVKSAMSDWKEFRSCEFAQRLAKLVSIFVAYGFIDEESMLSDHLMTLFRVQAWHKQRNSIDFVEMVIETCHFFIERAYAAFKHGDIGLLLVSDDDLAQMDKEYALLAGALPLLETGNLTGLEDYHESIKDESDYEVRVQKLNAQYASMLKVEKSPHMKNTLTNRLVILSKVRTALILSQKNSCVREKPFGLMIYGGSGVGKTMLNSIATKVVLHHNGFSSTKENIVTLNDNDKYQSEYKAHHLAVTMDDFGNTRADKYEGSPTAKIIDFLNNVPKAALNPNAELKGNIMIRPKMVTVTTNVKHLMASEFSNEPVSILRRFELMWDAKLRPEFVDPKTGGVNRMMMKGMIPDAWLIDVNYVEILRSADPNQADNYRFVCVKENASIYEALELLKEESEKHFEFQKGFVHNVEALFNLELCEHADDPSRCPKCKRLETQGGCEFVDPMSEMADFPSDEEDSYVRDMVEEANVVDRAFKFAHETLQKAFGEKLDIVKKATCIALGITGSYFAVKQIYSLFRRMLPQGNMSATPVKIEGDEDSPWKRVVSVPVPVSTASMTATEEQIIALLERSIGHMFVYNKDRSKRRMCNVVPMCNNFWLAPAHMFEDEECEVEIQTTKVGVLGKNPTQIVGPEMWYKIPNTDFVLLNLTSGGDVPDLTRFLPLREYDLGGTHVTSVYKDRNGDVTKGQLHISHDGMVDSGVGAFKGFYYRYFEPTFKGLCMMTMISRSRKPFIAGFHLAGYRNSRDGAAGKITFEEIEDAIDAIREKRVLEVHSSGTMETVKYGIDFTPSGEIPVKSPVNWLSDEDGCQPVGEVYGPHPLGTRTFTSSVRKSPISDSVARIMDLPRLHGKPKGMNTWIHWQRDLSLMSHPTGRFRPKIMQLARDDMKRTVDAIFEQKPEMLNLVHPYSRDAILAGVDGVNSVDRVDLSTSMGFPINKQKLNFVHESDRKVEGISNPLDLDDEFWQEFERMEKKLACGERVNVTFRGNLKDEPTKFTKDKVRVFAGCEFAFTLLVRKFYLSIIRVIQTNWDDFECAVGINAQGPHWSRLVRKLTKHSKTRMIAGDYAAYDKRVCPEATLAAFQVMIDIAGKAGYTQEQLTIMRGIATEICLPVYEYNGILLKIFGSNPSGHPLTVIINNLQNSIYLRYAYYALHENEIVPDFSERVALVCYGDDNAMSVHDDEDKFNHTTVAEELGKVGIVYTMADKLAKSKPFIPLEEVTFLKRGFVYNEVLGEWVAPIEEQSICKSLHNYMHNRGSTTLPEQIAGDAIQNANREFFLHGREICEHRRKQLEQVRDENNLSTFVGDLPTYDEMLEGYIQKRDGTPEPKILDSRFFELQ